jgi:hypothetical protein
MVSQGSQDTASSSRMMVKRYVAPLLKGGEFVDCKSTIDLAERAIVWNERWPCRSRVLR